MRLGWERGKEDGDEWGIVVRDRERDPSRLARVTGGRIGACPTVG